MITCSGGSSTGDRQSGTRNLLYSGASAGCACHHLAFKQQNIDWQIWIEDGPQPLIRRFVITHKQEEGAPEFTALITHWNFSDSIPDSTFEFDPPPGSTEIATLSCADPSTTASVATALKA